MTNLIWPAAAIFLKAGCPSCWPNSSVKVRPQVLVVPFCRLLFNRQT